jgi:hypothetical protein
MRTSRYCLTLGAAALALTGLVAAFNYAVDPYLLFDVERVPGFNDLKPAAAIRERMMKAYQIERVRAHTIVIGSSRPDLGIDPASKAWPASAQPVYNMSLVGSDVPDGLKYVRHYVAMRPGQGLRTLVVGLDFESSLYVPAPAPAGPAQPHRMSELEERLAVDAEGRPNPARRERVWKDHVQGLLSLDALYDSIDTVRNARSDAVLNLEPNGHLSEAATRDVVRHDGYARVFDQKNIDTVQQYAKPRRVMSDTPDGPIRKLGVLHDLFAFAKQHGIDVVLMIQPAHVSRLELLDRMGYWADYERWKRTLTALAAQAGAGQRVALWDFGGYEPQVLETAPAKGSKPDMAWFWDPVHYNGKLGEKMIARMFDPAHPAAQSDRFGVLLTPANIDARLDQVRDDRTAFRDAMPQETARLARLACGNDPCPASTLAAAR